MYSLHFPVMGEGNIQLELAHGRKHDVKGYVELVGEII